MVDVKGLTTVQNNTILKLLFVVGTVLSRLTTVQNNTILKQGEKC